MACKKYLFVTGGVCSSLGKGVAASSIGVLLKAAGYKINMMKIDPYLNVDAGTMSPYQHGEVYVTNDGAETDLDLGNYERYVRVETSKLSSLTTGQVYQTVIDAERRGDYLGETVQVIPHITDEIKRRVRVLDEGKDSDIIIVELGGTVGDIEGLPFIEAVRQFAIEEGRSNVKFVHLTLVPVIKGSGELKTKPSQHSVKELMSMGIQPDFLFCRCEVMMPPSLKTKMALFCNIEEECIFTAEDVAKTVYEVPLRFHAQNADKIILDKLGLPYRKPDLTKWRKMVEIEANPTEIVNIAMIGKYINLEDTYKSIDAALKHGGIGNRVGVKIIKVDAEALEVEVFEDGVLKKAMIDHFESAVLSKIPNEDDREFMEEMYSRDNATNCCNLDEDIKEQELARVREILRFVGYNGLISEKIDGVLIPGGFGSRGIEGKIKAVNYTRTHKIPTLGICLGLQCMVIEYARNVCGYPNAHSREFEETAENPVIELLTNLKNVKYMGGTMRKGAAKSRVNRGTLAYEVYQKEEIEERHRHRYEVNPEYVETLERNGLVVSAVAEGGLVEMVELKDHPWYLGGQFHPEFKSSPIEPHPVFAAFIGAALKSKRQKQEKK